MSNGYNSRLAPGYDKGKCGDTEYFDDEDEKVLREKCALFADLVRNATHVVIHTGAGISTAAGIPDFRGPKGIWTAELNGETPSRGVDFRDARPSATHMAIKGLMDAGRVHYLITQNVDGLHLKSGVPREKLSELHGSVFSESCPECGHEYVHPNDIGGIGLKRTGRRCIQARADGSTCNGELRDNCLDWENALPDVDLDRADDNHRKADLAICIGTSLRIRPAGNMPMKTVRKNGKPGEGKLVIINLQTTHLDRHCAIRFHARCDKVMSFLCENLNIKIPEFGAEAYREKLAHIPLPPPAPAGYLVNQRSSSSSSSGRDCASMNDDELAASAFDVDSDYKLGEDGDEFSVSSRKRQRSSFAPPRVPTHSYGTRARKRARSQSDSPNITEEAAPQRTFVDLTETSDTSASPSTLSNINPLSSRQNIMTQSTDSSRRPNFEPHNTPIDGWSSAGTSALPTSSPTAALKTPAKDQLSARSVQPSSAVSESANSAQLSSPQRTNCAPQSSLADGSPAPLGIPQTGDPSNNGHVNAGISNQPSSSIPSSFSVRHRAGTATQRTYMD